MTAAHFGLLIAALGGAVIGLERQRTGHASGPQARFGGIRTFTLLGGLGGIAGGFAAEGWLPVAAVVLAAPAALIVAAYVAASRADIDGTTEVAALVVLAAGAVAGVGHMALSSAIVATTAVLLLEKSRLHRLAARIDDVALRASVRFAALALVILPLLPAGSFGPFGAFRPRELWALVLFFSGLNFAGWIARQLLGPHRGVIVAGLLGGLISSTSVTFSYARVSRHDGAGRVALALGTVGACTVMAVRVLATSAVLNLPLAMATLPFVWPSLAVGTLALVASALHPAETKVRPPDDQQSPLQLRAALQMAALFQVVLLVIGAVSSWWSLRALVATSALIGLTDLDALTLSLARSATGQAADAASVALAVGVLSNTLLKTAVAVVMGSGVYRLIVGVTLGLMAGCVAGALWFF